MHKTYEPDSRFVERLEWQLSSEYRRLDRMKSSKKIAVPRRMAVIAVMAGVLMTSVAVIKAVDIIKDSWRRKIEIARMETDVELKKARLDITQELAAGSEKLFSSGLIQEEERRATKLGAEKARLDLEKSRLNLDEVKASGFPPRDELHAPIVGGRDFVSERLAIDIQAVEADLKLLANHLERLRELVEKAVAPEGELARIQAEIDARKATIGEILKRIGLRKRFVAGEITAQEVEIKDRMAVAESNLNQAQSRVDVLKKQWERLQTLEARGMISPMESKQLRYMLDAAQAERKLAAVEIGILEKLD